MAMAEAGPPSGAFQQVSKTFAPYVPEATRSRVFEAVACGATVVGPRRIPVRIPQDLLAQLRSEGVVPHEANGIAAFRAHPREFDDDAACYRQAVRLSGRIGYARTVEIHPLSGPAGWRSD